MYALTSKQMYDIEKITFEDFKIPSIVLMENAGIRVFDYIVNRLEFKSVAIFCGIGNNGGDGYVIARHLINNGFDVTVYIADDTDKIKNDALINLTILQKMNCKIINLNQYELDNITLNYDIAIDCIFGIGLSRSLSDYYKNIIKFINKFSFIVSVDIASGVNADSGKILDVAVKANLTLTFGFKKLGHILYPGSEYAGEVVVLGIGIPKLVYENLSGMVNYYNDDEIKSLLPKRGVRTNKGSFGKLNVFAGCKEMTGAAYLVSKSSYKVGCGYVKGYFTEHVVNILQTSLYELVYYILPDINGGYCLDSYNYIFNNNSHEFNSDNNSHYFAIGSGIGTNDNTKQFVTKFLNSINGVGVIDGDGLNIISSDLEIIKNKDFILTPHPKEMSRLTGLTVDEILDNPIKIATEFSMVNKVVVVLKDKNTIVASPNGEVYINTTGNNALAKAGSGDVLTGVVAGFLAQGLDVFKAACLGVYIHGRAADLAVLEVSNYSLLASELINYLDVVLKKICD